MMMIARRMSDSSTQPSAPRAMWIEGAVADSYVAFRGSFDVTRDSGGSSELFAWGASTFSTWINGKPLIDGPTRTEAGRHEAVQATFDMAHGRQVLAVLAHREGITTRL